MSVINNQCDCELITTNAIDGIFSQLQDGFRPFIEGAVV